MGDGNTYNIYHIFYIIIINKVLYFAGGKTKGNISCVSSFYAFSGTYYKNSMNMFAGVYLEVNLVM